MRYTSKKHLIDMLKKIGWPRSCSPQLTVGKTKVEDERYVLPAIRAESVTESIAVMGRIESGSEMASSRRSSWLCVR